MKIVSTSALMLATTFVIAQQDTAVIPAKHEYKARYQSQITLTDNGAGGWYAKVEKGKAVVFEYRFESSHQPQIADDELVTFYSFQTIPPRSGKFILKGKDLVNAKAYHSRNCFCIDRGTHLVTDGEITGVRLSRKTWLIKGWFQVTIKLPEGERVEVKKINAVYQIQ
ncbi:MAG: hypothetical protein MUE96_11590 [Bacteroidia bacterium]|jgi:hypothetical protein|nr:hypothetical protein [Bacteroidia bacterium]